MRTLTGIVLAALALLATLATSAQAQGPRRVALIISNSAYANAPQLANPGNDARIVADALKRAGFQTVDVMPNVTLASFQRALRDFRAKAAGAEVALVYYAGHGIEGSGKNWLIPTDASLASELDLSYEAIDLDRVLESVSGASLRVVILDACRNNPFGRSWRSGTRAVSRGLGGVDADDVLVIYAAAPGQVASDGVGNNGPFAVALAQRLPQAGLPIQLLGGVVRDDVLRTTGGSQRPFVSASITGTPYFLVGGGPAQAAPAAPPRDPDADAALASKTCADWKRYKQDFPNGKYVATADEWINSSACVARVAAKPPSDIARSAVVASIEGKWVVQDGKSVCGINDFVITRIDADNFRYRMGPSLVGARGVCAISTYDGERIACANDVVFDVSTDTMTYFNSGQTCTLHKK